MPPSASPASISTLLNSISAAPSVSGATNAVVGGADFAQLMQGAIARQTPSGVLPASGGAVTATPAEPTPQTLLATLQQLMTESEQTLTPDKTASLQAEWQAFFQQLSAWLHAEGGRSNGASARHDPVQTNLVGLARQMLVGANDQSTPGLVQGEDG